MSLDIDELRRVCNLVKAAATEELLARFERVRAVRKADGSVITAADLAMQGRLQRELAAIWPAFELLGEEMTGAEQAALVGAPGRGLWCLDPLDGTGNFAAGIPFFAVSLALIENGSVQAAVVFDPVRNECFSALRGQGAWLDGEPLTTPPSPAVPGDAMAIVDLKRLPAPLVRSVAHRAPYRSQRSFGSVALDWCWLACGRCQLYLHGGQKLWDYAAGQLILAEAGGAGGLLDDYRGDWQAQISLRPRIAVAATHDALLGAWRRWIAEAFESSDG
jgi:myo-inositol-1(or 4)-monophosphatase